MKDIFISYRRDGGDTLAQLIYTKLTMDGYSVFFDVESLRSGDFNEAIYKKIDECTDFLLILPKNGLDRCKDPKDWVRLEIEHALKKKKNIIPLMMRGFEFPEDLPESIRQIKNLNGVEQPDNLFFEALLDVLKEKRFFSKPKNSAPVYIEEKEKNTDETTPETYLAIGIGGAVFLILLILFLIFLNKKASFAIFSFIFPAIPYICIGGLLIIIGCIIVTFVQQYKEYKDFGKALKETYILMKKEYDNEEM